MKRLCVRRIRRCFLTVPLILLLAACAGNAQNPAECSLTYWEGLTELADKTAEEALLAYFAAMSAAPVVEHIYYESDTSCVVKVSCEALESHRVHFVRLSSETGSWAVKEDLAPADVADGFTAEQMEAVTGILSETLREARAAAPPTEEQLREASDAACLAVLTQAPFVMPGTELGEEALSECQNRLEARYDEAFSDAVLTQECSGFAEGPAADYRRPELVLEVRVKDGGALTAEDGTVLLEAGESRFVRMAQVDGVWEASPLDPYLQRDEL